LNNDSVNREHALTVSLSGVTPPRYTALRRHQPKRSILGWKRHGFWRGAQCTQGRWHLQAWRFAL